VRRADRAGNERDQDQERLGERRRKAAKKALVGGEFVIGRTKHCYDGFSCQREGARRVVRKNHKKKSSLGGKKREGG